MNYNNLNTNPTNFYGVKYTTLNRGKMQYKNHFVINTVITN